MKTQKEKEDYALELINSFGGSIKHALSCIERMVALTEIEEAKQEYNDIMAILQNNGENIAEKTVRVLLKKQLLQEHKVLESWQNFFGDDYSVKVDVISSEQGKTLWVFKTYNPNNKSDGLLCLTYENVKTHEGGALLEGEWYCRINENIQHLTPYVMENFARFYDNNLNLLTNK